MAFSIWQMHLARELPNGVGANLFNNEYIDFLSAKDMIAERFTVKGGEE